VTAPIEEPQLPPAASGSPLLTVEGLEVVYNRVQLAVHGVSLQAAQQEIVAVLGSNGAGKSTTLRAITGFLPGDDAQITRGRIVFDGRDVTGARPHVVARRGLVLVPERDKVFTTLTVAENLAVVPQSADRDGRAAAEALIADLFPALQRRRTSMAGYLSGGERQMLAIAKALLLLPRMLLIDELSFGLAPQMIELLMQTLRVVHERHDTGIVLVEQNAAAALDVADRVYVIESGAIVLADTAAAVASNENIQAFYLGGAEAEHDYGSHRRTSGSRRWT
jgi:branched-chain amino acid transport system ATP-binding protein